VGLILEARSSLQLLIITWRSSTTTPGPPTRSHRPHTSIGPASILHMPMAIATHSAAAFIVEILTVLHLHRVGVEVLLRKNRRV
jgi:hypothetical protein